MEASVGAHVKGELASELGLPRTGTLLRGLHLLEVLADGCDGSVTELAARTGLDKGTASRVLTTLRTAGYVRQDPGTRRYRLSGRILRLARGYANDLDLRSVAHPHLSRLRDQVDETVHLAVREDARVIYIDRLEATRSLRLASAIGHTEPMPTTALGRAILSRIPVAQRATTVRQLTGGEPDGISAQQLTAELDRAARQGYAVDHEENQEQVTCVAAGIVDAVGYPIAAISCSGPSFRMTDRIEDIGALCRVTAESISRHLDGTDHGR